MEHVSTRCRGRRSSDPCGDTGKWYPANVPRTSIRLRCFRRASLGKVRGRNDDRRRRSADRRPAVRRDRKQFQIWTARATKRRRVPPTRKAVLYSLLAGRPAANPTLGRRRPIGTIVFGGERIRIYVSLTLQRVHRRPAYIAKNITPPHTHTHVIKGRRWSHVPSPCWPYDVNLKKFNWKFAEGAEKGVEQKKEVHYNL